MLIYLYFYAIVSFSFVCVSRDSLLGVVSASGYWSVRLTSRFLIFGEGNLGLDHNGVYASGYLGTVCVCSAYRHLHRSKPEPIHTRMFNEGSYGAEVVLSSGNVTNCGTWGPRAQRQQAGGTISLCDLGRELSLARLLTFCPWKREIGPGDLPPASI